MTDRKDIVVYVAGPITNGPLDGNIRQACEAGMRLLKAGLSPHVPHLSCFMGARQLYEGGIFSPFYLAEVLPEGTTHEDWYGVDMPFVRRSDCLLRISGESKGADMEVAEAMRCGIPVFHTVEDVLTWAAWRPADRRV